jgi:hypothetical protein
MTKYLANTKIYFLVSSIMIVVALQIAWQTRYRAHPDEISHGNGFCYFETHSWIPNLNSDDIFYDPYGGSRVYDAEVVYLLYGQVVGRIRPFAEPILRSIKPKQFLSPGCDPAIEFYRWLNIGLYGTTLWMVFLAARRERWLISIAGLLLCIPQVVYVYSYANDDAWGISFSIFLFLFVACQTTKPHLTIPDMIYWGILTGLVLLSKKNYWLSIPFSYALIIPRINRVAAVSHLFTRGVIARVGVLACTGLFVAAPFLLIYPLSQGNYSEKIDQMNEQRARPELKPSSIGVPGYRMAARGIPFQMVLLDYQWFSFTARSFYGLFSYFSVVLPSELYRFAATILLTLLGITALTIMRVRQKLSQRMSWLLGLAPIFLAMNVLLSLYRSWIYDYQYQGRYLFPSLIPLAIIFGGTLDVESTRMQQLRMLLWTSLYGLGIYVLWTQVAQNPVLG